MGKMRCSYRVLLRKLRERVHFKDTGVVGRIIFKWIFKKWVGGLEWIAVAQNRDMGRAAVNVVMNIRVP
jgi:hypothetical protein